MQVYHAQVTKYYLFHMIGPEAQGSECIAPLAGPVLYKCEQNTYNFGDTTHTEYRHQRMRPWKAERCYKRAPGDCTAYETHRATTHYSTTLQVKPSLRRATSLASPRRGGVLR